MRGVGNHSPHGGIMPLYEYECLEHGKFSTFQPMFGERKATCPKCGKPAEARISACNCRFAEPVTFLQELPKGRGYKKLGWKADSGISPKPGQPFKTAKEVDREEYGGIKEI